MKPHIRKVEGRWMCTFDRSERHLMRGIFGDNPKDAYHYFLIWKNLGK